MFREKNNGGVRVHILTAEVPLPPKTPILGVTNNKVQLNKMLAGAMMDPGFIGMPLLDRCTASLLLVPTSCRVWRYIPIYCALSCPYRGRHISSYIWHWKDQRSKVARNARLPLHAIGDTQADEAIVLEQAMSFILACHGKGFSSMSEARIKMWRKKTDIGSALKLCSLPPTTEAFTENAKRAHLQATQWRASIEGTVPLIDALMHGWEHDGSYLKPTAVPEGTLSALVAVLEMIRCGCASGCSMLH